MSELYESKISTARWMVYDIAGNAGWILYFIMLYRHFFDMTGLMRILTAIPAICMAIGIIELISERFAKLDWILPKRRLYRGFGALTAGGLLGMLVSVSAYLQEQEHVYGWLFIGAALCALFAGLLFREYRPIQDKS